MNDKIFSVAVVVPGLKYGGGVPEMAKFLYRMLAQSELFQPSLISLATSAQDANSFRLFSLKSWIEGVTLATFEWSNIPVTHVGANLTELEFQRYRPRRKLTELLNSFDLVQVVAGGPAIALAVTESSKPTCVFAATTVYQDRFSRLKKLKGVKRLVNEIMIRVVTQMERQALKKVDHVFAESVYTYDLLNKFVPKSKLSIGVPGVDTKMFFPAERYQKDSYILAVGRFADPRKNVRLLFMAFYELCHRMSNCPKLVLAGLERPNVEDWNLAIQLGISNNIIVKENVPLKELACLYREAALFVLSSNEEGLGIVILEAMASGLPVVSTRCGGPETAVQHNQTGLLVDVNDVESLAAAMWKLLQEPKLRAMMGETARVVAVDRFSLEAAGCVYLSKYEELLETTRY